MKVTHPVRLARAVPARLTYVQGGAAAQLVATSKFQELLRTRGMVEFVEFLVEFFAEPAASDGYREERHAVQPAAGLSPAEPD